ncbi:MAG TPA: hypothetical protein VJ891_16165 [Casimicrobiaceae bacterium]|nr:hypothetical protein [Casimicrobiaceae bacterium]
MPRGAPSRRFAHAIESIVLPALVAALPWRVAWPALRMLVSRGGLFSDECERAHKVAASLGFGDDSTWRLTHGLTRAVDYADPMLSAFRSDRWMARHLHVEGDALPGGACVFVGFHYGTGFWSLRHLRSAGHRVSFVSAPIGDAPSPLRSALLHARQKQIANAGGAPVIYVGGASDRIREQLRAGVSVLALIDVPEPGTATRSASLLDRKVVFPDGILRIAAAENVPMIGFIASLDRASGARRLRFVRLPSRPPDALSALAALLDEAVRNDPASWHFWAQWPRFLAARS